MLGLAEALSKELLGECSTFGSLKVGDFIGTVLLMKDEGVSNGCVRDKKAFGVCCPLP